MATNRRAEMMMTQARARATAVKTGQMSKVKLRSLATVTYAVTQRRVFGYARQSDVVERSTFIFLRTFDMGQKKWSTWVGDIEGRPAMAVRGSSNVRRSSTRPTVEQVPHHRRD